MNLALHKNGPTRWKRGIIYGMLLLAVMFSLPLGMTIAAMGAWYAIEGGSLMYLPLGLLVIMAMMLFTVHWKRSSARPAGRLRLVWVGIPLVLLTTAGASVGAFALAAAFVR